MAVRKRGGIWYYDFMIRHVRYREAIPEARTKAQAEQVETKVRLSIFEGKYCKLHQNKVPTLKQFIKETFLPWSKANKRSYQSDRWRSNVLIDWFDKKRLDEITPFLIEKFKKERREGKTRRGKERSPASVNREIELLSRILTMAVDNGLIETNPCRKVRKLRLDNRRIRYLSVEEEERLMAVLTGRKAHLRPLVILAVNTGMRRGELFNLTWEKVDFTRNVIYVTNTKSGKDRVVPMNQAVRDELIRMRELANGEFVLKTAWRQPVTYRHRTSIRCSFPSSTVRNVSNPGRASSIIELSGLVLITSTSLSNSTTSLMMASALALVLISRRRAS
jgi:integrase